MPADAWLVEIFAGGQKNENHILKIIVTPVHACRRKSINSFMLFEILSGCQSLPYGFLLTFLKYRVFIFRKISYI